MIKQVNISIITIMKQLIIVLIQTEKQASGLKKGLGFFWVDLAYLIKLFIYRCYLESLHWHFKVTFSYYANLQLIMYYLR